MRTKDIVSVRPLHCRATPTTTASWKRRETLVHIETQHKRNHKHRQNDYNFSHKEVSLVSSDILCDILVSTDFSQRLKIKRTHACYQFESLHSLILCHSMKTQFKFFTKTSHSGLHSVVYIKYCLFIKLGAVSQLTILIK